MMTLYDKIVELYPELRTMSPDPFGDGTIVLQNDGGGDYIKTWNYSKPKPAF